MFKPEDVINKRVAIKADTADLKPEGTQNLQLLTAGFKEGFIHRQTLTAKEKEEMVSKARQLSVAAVQRFRYTEPFIRLHQALEVRTE